MDATFPLRDTALSSRSSLRLPWDVLRLVGKAIALIGGTIAAITAFVIVVPDGNDYALVTLRKHARLAMGAPKASPDWTAAAAHLAAPSSQAAAGPAGSPNSIVFVGGSNLAFGLDSAMIEQATGTRVVNMGMNGFFGVRFMLEEVKPQLKSSDLVVVSLEYDNFFKSVDGTATDLLMVVKTNLPASSYLTWKQRIAVSKEIPFVAQQKVLRLMRDASRELRHGARHPIDSIETLAAFNAHGDLTAHLDAKWPYEMADGMNLSATPLNLEVIALLQQFTHEMRGRGVDVMISYTPAMRSYYERHKRSIDRVHELLSQSPGLVVPSPPSDFAFREDWFFDTVYHLNGPGRAARTQEVIDDIGKVQKRSRPQ
jgi:hypothetical protein